MKRILFSQSEKNDGSDYLVVDGILTEDKNIKSEWVKKIINTDNWNLIYEDDYIFIKENNKSIFLKSYYKDKDVIGRSIFYMYLIDAEVSLESVLNYLEKDSRIIQRTVDRERTIDIVQKIKSRKDLKKNNNKRIAIIVGTLITIGLLMYLLINLK